MISLKHALKKYIEIDLGRHGFSIDKKRDSSSWIYSRMFNGQVKQLISFQKSNHMDQAFKVELSTSIKKFDTKQIVDFIGRREDWWIYTDELSLEASLSEIKEILSNYGYSWLDIKSVPDIKPDATLSKELITDPNGRMGEFREKYGFSIETLDSLSNIENFLLSKKLELEDCPDWDLLLNTSAFVGEWICYKYDGKWVWNEDYDTPAVRTSKGNFINVLIHVANFWSKPQLPEYRLTNMLEF